jgi:hypothetical protein
VSAPEGSDRGRRRQRVAVVIAERNVRHGDDGRGGGANLLKQEYRADCDEQLATAIVQRIY